MVRTPAQMAAKGVAEVACRRSSSLPTAQPPAHRALAILARALEPKNNPEHLNRKTIHILHLLHLLHLHWCVWGSVLLDLDLVLVLELFINQHFAVLPGPPS